LAFGRSGPIPVHREKSGTRVQAQFYSDVQGVWEAERDACQASLADLTEEGLILTSEIDDMASAEVRAALTLTRRAADVVVSLAYELRVRLPAVWAALDEGRIDIAKARVICDQTGHLDVEIARRVADQGLTRASKHTTRGLSSTPPSPTTSPRCVVMTTSPDISGAGP
jgi:hypothetical protein